MRNRRHVANRTHFNARRGQSTNGRFAAGTRSADTNIDAAYAMIARHVGGVRSRLLSRKRRPLTRSAEAQRSGTLPRQNVAVHVGDGHDRVVERRLYVAQPVRNVLALLLLERLFLALFLWCGCAARCCWFRHIALAPSS